LELWQIFAANFGIWLGIGALFGAGYLLDYYRGRPRRLIDKIKRQHPNVLYHDRLNQLVRFRQDQIDLNMNPNWRRALLVITPQHIALYHPYARRLTPFFACTPDELQGFWRFNDPVDHETTDAIWLHARLGTTWHLLRLRHDYITLGEVMGALRAFAHEEQERASRRPHPHKYDGVSLARIARQTIHGAWEMHDTVELYLMPLFLVIFKSGAVQQQIALADIQDIIVLPRLDNALADGLISLSLAHGAETLTFALRDYQDWADDLGQATRRNLEAPVMQKQKDAEG
jgi:hypothetical protein